ncbi:hypothetical protein Sste5346_000091 [Sporothrix stenoceras]|uniref:2EXR domain-containing protein n=1 Tax=Sporothrix stenoceras TaxID=5173 RepID=A0ABR3ZTI4_9PEZI
MTAEFHLFPALPYEIRTAIWELCLPHRVEKIECLFRYIRWPYIGCTLYAAHMANRRPPAMSRVCRESRTIVLKTGEPYTRFADALASRFPVAPRRWGQYRDEYYIPVDTTAKRIMPYWPTHCHASPTTPHSNVTHAMDDALPPWSGYPLLPPYTDLLGAACVSMTLLGW